MIAIEVTATGDLEQAFAVLGDGGHAAKLADKTVRIVAYRYRSFLRKEYLSGQMLGQRTGSLVKSLVVGRKKGSKLVYLVGSKKVKNKATGTYDANGIKLVNIYEHAGGYTIQPKNAKVLTFFGPAGETVFTKSVQGKARPFMTESSRAFAWPAAFDKATEEIIAKEFKKLEQAGAYVPGGLE